jgi:hypothetical protein
MFLKPGCPPEACGGLDESLYPAVQKVEALQLSTEKIYT